MPAATIRVFVSSTFRDMQAERDLLVKRVFPELRARCRALDLEFVGVDLRWGVPEDQAEHGGVLPVCLAEIDQADYFIGLLGARYGWVPSDLSDDLLAGRPWLVSESTPSITELEIRHAIGGPSVGRPRRTFFYLRSDRYLRTVARESLVEFAPESDRSAERLAALKARLGAQRGLAVREYDAPEAFVEPVIEDLWEAIRTDHPAPSSVDPLDREAAAHLAFATERARAFVGRHELLRQLEEHASVREGVLVLAGEAGIGKSALLARFLQRFRANHPDVWTLAHFVGSTSPSTNHLALVQRPLQELQRRNGFEPGQPDSPSELIAILEAWLPRAASSGPIVLVIDGLDLLENPDASHDLAWLPESIPKGCRLILAASGRSLKAAARNGWRIITVPPLSIDERHEAIREYLLLHRKRLSDARIERIARGAQTGLPLFLRALMDELRLVGAHDRLDQYIDGYLQAPDSPSLFQKILARWEADYEGESDLVGDALGLILAARDGLSETELLSMLGDANGPLPPAFWSPFFLAVQESLVHRSGVLTFFHPHLREAVREAYLPTPAHELAMHRRLADFFDAQPLDARRIAELPWQLAHAHEWARLNRLFGDLDFVTAAWSTGPVDRRLALGAARRTIDVRGASHLRGTAGEPRERASFGRVLDGTTPVGMRPQERGTRLVGAPRRGGAKARERRRPHRVRPSGRGDPNPTGPERRRARAPREHPAFASGG